MSTAAKKAKDRATRLHSILTRSRGRCENPACGRTENLQCAHIVSRRYSATRVDLANSFALCAKCHLHFTEWPLEFAAFVTDQIGAERYEALKAKAETGGKVDWNAEADRLATLVKSIVVSK